MAIPATDLTINSVIVFGVFERIKVMIAMALIHLHFGGDSPLGYVNNTVLLKKNSATNVLSSKVIQQNRTTMWKDFSQCIFKYMAMKT